MVRLSHAATALGFLSGSTVSAFTVPKSQATSTKNTVGPLFFGSYLDSLNDEKQSSVNGDAINEAVAVLERPLYYPPAVVTEPDPELDRIAMLEPIAAPPAPDVFVEEVTEIPVVDAYDAPPKQVEPAQPPAAAAPKLSTVASPDRREALYFGLGATSFFLVPQEIVSFVKNKVNGVAPEAIPASELPATIGPLGMQPPPAAVTKVLPPPPLVPPPIIPQQPPMTMEELKMMEQKRLETTSKAPPVVQKPPPVVQQAPPVPVVQKPPPIVQQVPPPPVVQKPPPVVQKPPPVVQQAPPVPVVKEVPKVVPAPPAPVVQKIAPPVVKEVPPPVVQKAPPAPAAKPFFGYAPLTKECATAMTKNFPNALPISDFNKELKGMLATRGYTKENTLLSTSVCPDEINSNFVLDMLHTWEMPKQFTLGGLAGVPFVGTSGMDAFLHHVPNSGGKLGKVVIVFGPHIGISEDGQVGKIARENQGGASSACGAAIGGYKAIMKAKAEDAKSKMGNLSASNSIDAQEEYIIAQLDDKLNRFPPPADGQGDPIAHVTRLMYVIVKEFMLRTMNALEDKGTVWNEASEIALVGGILINTAEGHSDYFQPLMFECRKGQVEDLLGDKSFF